ncbi:MAG: pyridoxine 5'-phosphate synthase [Steroidobacteraceae bacterium]
MRMPSASGCARPARCSRRPACAWRCSSIRIRGRSRLPCTSARPWSNCTPAPTPRRAAARRRIELDRLRAGARLAAGLGLEVHAGHGLHYQNVQPVAAIPEIVELNIGHAIIGRAVFSGLAAAVRDMKSLMVAARA